MIRAEVQSEIARLISNTGQTGVATVSSYWPGVKSQSREMVFGDRTTGSVSFPYAMEPPRMQRDVFISTWVVRITATDGVPAAQVRRDELSNVVTRILASDDLLQFATATERITDTNPDAQGIQVETVEGDDPESGLPVAIATITVPIETQTVNAQEG